MPLSKAKDRARKRAKRVGGKIRLELSVKKVILPEREKIPLYNPAVHRAGDKVRMITGEIYIIPQLDADGQRVVSQW